MTSDDPVEIPGLDDLGAVREAGAVLASGGVPQEAALPDHVAAGVHDGAEQLGEDAGGGVEAGAGILLGGGQVEEDVGLDQGLGRLVQEDELLVLVAVDELVVELVVELRADAHLALVLRAEHVRELDALGRRVALALLWQAFHANHLGLRVLLGPRADEDVVLDVGRNDVLHGAHALDLGLDVGRQGDGAEDGQRAGAQLDDGTAAADLHEAKAQEGHGEGGDGGGDVADDHHLGRVGGDELGGGFGGHVGCRKIDLCVFDVQELVDV